MRPVQDANVMARVQHVPGVRAGSVVFWDNRLPHANAYRHDGTEPRVVVYCSLLPPIALNRAYAQRQLERWKQGLNPTDQWTGSDNKDSANNNKQQPSNNETTNNETSASKSARKVQEPLARLPKLARQLLAAEEW